MGGFFSFLTGGLLGLLGGGGSSSSSGGSTSMLQGTTQGASPYASGWQPYARDANVSMGGVTMLYDDINDLGSQSLQGGLLGAVENLASQIESYAAIAAQVYGAVG